MDDVPSVELKYGKPVSARRTQTSKRAQYRTNNDLAASLDKDGRRQVSGMVTPDIGAEMTLGSVEELSLYKLSLSLSVTAKTSRFSLDWCNKGVFFAN